MILRAHSDPALRLPEVVKLMGGRVDRNLTSARLRPILERHPESFRVLDALPGGWDVGAHTLAEGEAGMQHVWVVVVGPLVSPQLDGDEARIPLTALRLRESVRWLARGLDGRSRVDTSRWDVIARAERETRELVLQSAVRSNNPDLHSPSASTSTQRKPAPPRRASSPAHS